MVSEIGHAVITAKMDLDTQKAERKMATFSKHAISQMKARNRVRASDISLKADRLSGIQDRIKQGKATDRDYLMKDKLVNQIDLLREEILKGTADINDTEIDMKSNLEKMEINALHEELKFKENVAKSEIELKEQIHKKQLQMDVKRLKKQRKMEEEEQEDTRSFWKRMLDAYNPRFFARYSSGHIYTGTGGNVMGPVMEGLGFGGGGGKIKGGQSTAKGAAVTGGAAKSTLGDKATGLKLSGMLGKLVVGVGIIAVGILALVVIMKKLWNGWKQSQVHKYKEDAVQMIADTIVSFIFSLVLITQNIYGTITKAFKVGLDWILGILPDPIQGFHETIQLMKDGAAAIGDVFKKAGTWLTDIFTEANRIWMELTNPDWQGIKANMLMGIGGSLTAVIKPVETALMWASDGFSTAIETGDRVLGNIITNVDNWIQGFISKFNVIKSAIQNKIDDILDIPKFLFDKFNRGLLQPLGHALETMINSVIGGFNKVVGWANKLGLGIDYIKRVDIINDEGKWTL